MVIRDFHSVSVGAAPVEANSVLIINPYAVLTAPITVEFLQPVSGRDL